MAERTTPNPSGSAPSVWRGPSERVQLTESLIEAKAEVDRLRRGLREWGEVVEQDPSAGAYVRVLLARIAQLEVSVETLSKRPVAA